MQKKIFQKPAVEAKHRAGLLGANFDCFLRWMQEHGYSRHSMRANIQNGTHFAKYLQRRGIRSIHELEGAGGQKILVAYQRYWKAKGYWNRSSGLRLYIRALKEAGVLSSSPSSSSPLFHETQEYISFLKNQRGLSEGTIRLHTYWTEKFLHFLRCQKGASSLPTFGIADVDRFIEQEGVRLKRPTQQTLANSLRVFLRFQYQSGKLAIDFSYFITRPRRYKLESLPTVLNWDEVQKILGSVDRSSKNGLRQYAILVFLSTYGLRAGEVANLKIEDIDWRKETIHIASGKTGRDLWLPLIPKVGNAIISYLKHGRPTSKHREIFLLTKAPWTPIKSHSIRSIVVRQLQIAGLSPRPRGPHLFRHSFATHLLRSGVSLKKIGDLLGHRATESTHIYTKTATENLREVALEVPEVK